MAKQKLKLAKVLRRLGVTTFYQLKRPEGTEERWKLIDANLDESDRSLFDVGCNVGQFTARAAQRGIFSVGADLQLPAVAEALKSNGGQANLAFGNWSFSPDNIRGIPHFDVILCLSVHHYWHRAYGEEQCWEMVRHLARSAGKFFFEPSVRLKKYGQTPPTGFVEGNSAHLEDRIREEITGPLGKSVVFLGETEAPGDERFRPLFLIT
jgi:SAM-dependent methyltransferase